MPPGLRPIRIRAPAGVPAGCLGQTLRALRSRAVNHCAGVRCWPGSTSSGSAQRTAPRWSKPIAMSAPTPTAAQTSPSPAAKSSMASPTIGKLLKTQGRSDRGITLSSFPRVAGSDFQPPDEIHAVGNAQLVGFLKQDADARLASGGRV